MSEEKLRVDRFVREFAKTKNWITVEPVNKGWSKDKKYYIKDKYSQRLLLRVSDISEYEKKKLEYERITILSKLNFYMSMPVEFDICNVGKNVYMLLTWISGENSISVLPTLAEADQYKYGLEAGRILKIIHSVKDHIKNISWSDHYSKKIARVIEKYQNCSFKINNENKIIDFIISNIHYLKGQDITLQHGDYHVGNFIITDDNKLGIIDFNRGGYGDPWEEYDRYVFTWSISIPFAIGQINGYFNDNVPDHFFKLMSLYNATNIIASIPWAVPYGITEVQKMQMNSDLIFNSYCGFESYVPTWYLSNYS